MLLCFLIVLMLLCFYRILILKKCYFCLFFCPLSFHVLCLYLDLITHSLCSHAFSLLKTVTCPTDLYRHLAGVGNHVTLPLSGFVFQCLVRLTLITQKQIFASDTKVLKSLLLDRAMPPVCMTCFCFFVVVSCFLGFFPPAYIHCPHIAHFSTDVQSCLHSVFLSYLCTMFAHRMNVIICFSQSLA